MSKPVKVEVEIAGRKYIGRRSAEGEISVTDDAGVTWEMWQGIASGSNGSRCEKCSPAAAALAPVFLAVHAAIADADQKRERTTVAAPTAAEIADEQHARRWAAATNDPIGNY